VDRKSCSAEGRAEEGEEEFVDGTHDGPLLSTRCARTGEIDKADEEAEEAGPDGADHGTNPEVDSILLNFVGRCSDGSW
jgi:hypothetical protein